MVLGFRFLEFRVWGFRILSFRIWGLGFQVDPQDTKEMTDPESNL